MKELADLLCTSSEEINKAVRELRLKQQDLMDYCTRISNFEHEGDKVYRNAIAELFETKDAVEIIKLKEVYETLESALDRSRDVADVIEDIALKYR
jgi:uncharacterized protein Yka (UPF0111/DUF47 family)